MIPKLPEDSIHPPESKNPSPAKGLKKLTNSVEEILYQLLLKAEKNKQAGEQNLFMQITPQIIEEATHSLDTFYLNKYLELIPKKQASQGRLARQTGFTGALIHGELIKSGYNQAIDEITKRLKEGQDV